MTEKPKGYPYRRTTLRQIEALLSLGTHLATAQARKLHGELWADAKAEMNSQGSAEVGQCSLN
jgi:hypothetical protein